MKSKALYFLQILAFTDRLEIMSGMKHKALPFRRKPELTSADLDAVRKERIVSSYGSFSRLILVFVAIFDGSASFS